MEPFTKIIYLLSLFFPVMLFFTVGLWIAWMLWFKHSRNFHEALEEHHQLVAELNDLYSKQYELTEQYEHQLRLSKENRSSPNATFPEPTAVTLEIPSNNDSAEINALKQELNELRRIFIATEADACLDSQDSQHSFPSMHLVEKILTEFADEPVRNCPQFGIIYSEKPDFGDDLTKITTLTTNDAVRLNQLGIYNFRQIALWTPENSSAIKQRLQLSDGIDPTYWQTQAAHLQ